MPDRTSSPQPLVQRRARRGHRIALIAVASVLVAGASSAVAVSPAAAAFSYDSWISSSSGGANLRSCPSTLCQSLGYMLNGSRVHMNCWVDGQWVAPPNSNYGSARWFSVDTAGLGGSRGYVHSSLVANWTSVPRCP